MTATGTDSIAEMANRLTCGIISYDCLVIDVGLSPDSTVSISTSVAIFKLVAVYLVIGLPVVRPIPTISSSFEGGAEIGKKDTQS